MAADILHGMLDTAYLASHTLTGGNATKTSLDRALVSAILH